METNLSSPITPELPEIDPSSFPPGITKAYEILDRSHDEPVPENPIQIYEVFVNRDGDNLNLDRRVANEFSSYQEGISSTIKEETRERRTNRALLAIGGLAGAHAVYQINEGLEMPSARDGVQQEELIFLGESIIFIVSLMTYMAFRGGPKEAKAKRHALSTANVRGLRRFVVPLKRK